jgi:predicted outer membrane repeat protein
MFLKENPLKRLIALSTVVVALLALCFQVGLSAVITVNNTQDNLTAGNGSCTLREAIMNANANADTTGGDCAADAAGQDTINLPTGTIRLSIMGAGEDLNASGDLDVLGAIIFVGDPTSPTIIQGRGDRVFDINHGVTSSTSFTGVTITKGETTTNGGGIQIQGGARVNLISVTFNDNEADGHGGGIACDGCGIFQILTSTFTNNRADDDNSGAGDGGAIFINDSNTVLIQDTSIGISTESNTSEKNSAVRGGGIAVEGSSPGITIRRSTISGNEATGLGGGIFEFRNVVSITTISNSTISLNTTISSGGGIVSASLAAIPNMRLFNVTITGNIADSDANDTGDGGGLFVGSFNNVEVQNTIIAGNSQSTPLPALINPDCTLLGTISTLGNNLIGANLGCGASFPAGDPNINGDFVGTIMDPIDPKLDPLMSASPGIHFPQPDSPAVDNGKNTACAASPINNEDQRQLSRPKQFGPNNKCDIGAVELQIYEALSESQSIRVSLGYHVQFHCGEIRTAFSNNGDDVESIDSFETEISVVFPQERIPTTSVTTRDQVQIVQSPTITEPANFWHPGVMPPFVLVTLNPGKTFRITCSMLQGHPLTFDEDGNIATTINDELSGADDFFQGEIFIQSNNDLVVQVKKIQTTWMAVPKSGGGTEFKNGTSSISIFNVESARVSGSRVVNYKIPAQALPISTASIKTVAAPNKRATPAFSHLQTLGGKALTFREQNMSSRSIDVDVFGLNGRKIFSGSSTGNSLRWNLRTSRGFLAANGVYLYVIKIRGQDGKIIRSAVRKLVVLR